MERIYDSVAVAVLLGLAKAVAAQEELETCYGPGSIVGAIIGTLLITVALVASCFLLHKIYWRSRKGKHLVLVTDAENPGDQYAFDNPCFREATPIKQNIHDEKNSSKLEKNRWLEWSPLQSIGGHKADKVKSLDDSCINESALKIVSLKSHDFTGLGFNICGNMRDGIFVKDVLHRGPAFESGCINSGDRIDSVCISFRNMVFEDALTILSYASPYEVEVHVENGASSRPSTLIRSKRESNAVNSAERIQHPKYNRSQSISDLAEMSRSHNKRINQLHTAEKNRINQSLNKSHELTGSPNDYPTLKLTSHAEHKPEMQKLEMKAAPTKKEPDYHEREIVASEVPGNQNNEPQNKFHKFGIKVLPISLNPKMGTQVVTGTQKSKEMQTKNKNDLYNRLTTQNEKNSVIEKTDGNKVLEEKSETELDSSNDSLKKETKKDSDETDGVKAILTKGFQNLKEKINQNTLGKKKKNSESETEVEKQNSVENKGVENTNITITHKGNSDEAEKSGIGDLPVPKVRSTVTMGGKVKATGAQATGAQATGAQATDVPLEVTRAGDVARSNRKSVTDVTVTPRKSVTSWVVEAEPVKTEETSDTSEVTVINSQAVEIVSISDSSSDADSPRAADGVTRPKRSKGKAPAPPQRTKDENQVETAVTRQNQIKPLTNDMNEIKKESDMEREDKSNIFEPIQTDLRSIVHEVMNVKSDHIEPYDSDSDAESSQLNPKEPVSGTKIELNATQVTIHHSPTLDNGNEDEIETSRKAASLGDLSKLESDHTLSVILERAVSLDLADGSSQCGKKRKAPLPPPEDFPTVFDDAGYRKEPRLEGLNTFQRRLKKSSDFGTLEDALQEGPKSLDIKLTNGGSSEPLDLVEAHNTNIQEFSSWLAEVRKPKDDSEPGLNKMNSTSLVNVNVPASEHLNEKDEDSYTPNIVFSVNGHNLQDEYEKAIAETQTINFPGANSRTVLVISQPNSLELTSLSDSLPLSLPEAESVSKGYVLGDTFQRVQSVLTDCETSMDQFVTANESQLDTTVMVTSIEDEDVDDIPPKLPSTPMPVLPSSNPASFSSPLSSSLTYITEIKVSPEKGEPEDTEAAVIMGEVKEIGSPTSLSSDSIVDDEADSQTTIVTSTPLLTGKIAELLKARMNSQENVKLRREPKPLRTDRSLSFTDGYNRETSFESSDLERRGSDAASEYSKIPIRTMKSETGQKVLATIQSLAAKDIGKKTPESEYAKRVASLFSNANVAVKNSSHRKTSNGSENNHPNVSGFYLKSPAKDVTVGSSGRKVPPVVPPRKLETTLTSGKSTVTVELPTKANHNVVVENLDTQPDRSVVTFSSFMPENRPAAKISTWSEKEHGGINGDHLHMQVPGVVNLPVKTSATKIVFENKEMGDEEF